MTDYGLPFFEVEDIYNIPSTALAVSSLGHLASTAGTEGNWQVDIVDMLDPDQVTRIPTADEATALAFSFHGDILAAGGPGYINIFDARTGELLDKMNLP